MFEDQREHILQSLDSSHLAYYAAGIFNGPSLHFHLRALDAANVGDFERFCESVYALLASWGMHRMGPGGSKMREFEEFQTSLRSFWPEALSLQNASPEDLDVSGWRELNRLFCGLKSMASGTSLVGNSKVMAHALPKLIPPVDRRYTLRFLFGTTNVTNDLAWEWDKLQLILREFFYPLAREESVKLVAAHWQERSTEFKWDTSPLKILDNLVIGYMKSRV